MRKTLLGILVALAVIFMGNVSARATDLSALPQDLQDMIEDLLATRFPPDLKGITLDPEAPVAGEPTAISVEIYNPADLTQDETSEVYVLYSTDGGGSWEEIELESEDSKNWTGEFPGFDSGTEVVYAIRAMDTSTNVFTSVPCMATSDDLAPGNLIDGDCVHSGDDLSACEETAPRGCMMKMAADNDPIDDEEDTIPGYGDYVDQRISYDEENHYIDLAVESEVDGGTMTPTDIHLYGAVMINPDKLGNDTSIEALLTAGGVLLYSPPLKSLESTGMISDCLFGYNKANSFAIDTKKVKCLAKDNHLIFKVSNDLLPLMGDNESGIYHFLALTGVITDVSDFSNIKGKALDLTHVTAAQFTDANSFTVE